MVAVKMEMATEFQAVTVLHRPVVMVHPHPAATELLHLHHPAVMVLHLQVAMAHLLQVLTVHPMETVR